MFFFLKTFEREGELGLDMSMLLQILTKHFCIFLLKPGYYYETDFLGSKLQPVMKCMVTYCPVCPVCCRCSDFDSWIFGSGYAVASSSDDRMNEPPTSLGLVPHQVSNL